MKVSELIIEDRMRKVIMGMEAAKRNIDSKEIVRETAFTGRGLGLDSVGLFELVVSVEKEFDFFIEVSELGSGMFENVGTLVNYIGAKLNK